MDDIAEYLLVPQPDVTGTANRRRPATVLPPGSPPPVTPEGANALDALRKLLHDKALLQVLLRLTGKD